MTLEAKYEGLCVLCDAGIHVGDEIRQAKVWVHAGCRSPNGNGKPQGPKRNGRKKPTAKPATPAGQDGTENGSGQ